MVAVVVVVETRLGAGRAMGVCRATLPAGVPFGATMLGEGV